MIEKSNIKKVKLLILLISIITIFDIFTIITNIYVAQDLEGYGFPDILIYLKTAIFIFVLTILVLWAVNKNYNISKTNLKIIMYLAFITIIGYFFSLFMYKYVLLLYTADIIKNKILYGNPALIYNFSTKNYKTLSYILQIFSGFNSEIILFIEALFVQNAIMKLDTFSIKNEKEYTYDPFMFDKALLWLFGLLVTLSFLSINIFQFSYNLREAFEMAIALGGFVIAIPGLVTAIGLNSIENHTCTKTRFISSHRLLIIISIITSILFALLSIFLLEDLHNGLGTYRLYTSLGSVLVSIIIIFRVYRTMSLENK